MSETPDKQGSGVEVLEAPEQEKIAEHIGKRKIEVGDEVKSTLSETVESLYGELSPEDRVKVLKIIDRANPDQGKQLYEYDTVAGVELKDIPSTEKQRLKAILSKRSKESGLTMAKLATALYTVLRKRVGSGNLNIHAKEADITHRAELIVRQLKDKDPEIITQATTTLLQDLHPGEFKEWIKNSDEFTQFYGTGETNGINLKENPTLLVRKNLIDPINNDVISDAQKIELKRKILEGILGKDLAEAPKIKPAVEAKKPSKKEDFPLRRIKGLPLRPSKETTGTVGVKNAIPIKEISVGKGRVLKINRAKTAPEKPKESETGETETAEKNREKMALRDAVSQAKKLVDKGDRRSILRAINLLTKVFSPDYERIGGYNLITFMRGHSEDECFEEAQRMLAGIHRNTE